MELDKEFLLKALLQYNYFPLQKKTKENIPPILHSKHLTPEISKKIVDLPIRKKGYDQVEYRVTRFNNIPRLFSIPHPLPYVKLCHKLCENWENIKHITKNKNSLIIPKKHRDGRIIIMDYEKPKNKIERHINHSFNKKFYARTDISNFYPSIYSHSIPWALVGFHKGKNNRDKKAWFNQIDKFQRLLNRNETNGIPIGPATSNIICEIILSEVDKKLADENFEFERYIDDYIGYFSTYEEAEKFIRVLSEELSKYKLVLNAKKTIIDKLPIPSSNEWIVDLITRLPPKEHITKTNMIRFLDYALLKQGTNPDGSVLKYAAKSIINYALNGYIKNDNAKLLLQYLLGLCSKYPVIIPILNPLFEKTITDSNFEYKQRLLNVLHEHTINKRSDAMTWILYYLNKYSQEVDKETALEIIKSDDCIAILFLYLSRKYDKEVKDFYNNLKKKSDLYLLDRYWLLLYQLFFDEQIPNPYEKDVDKGETFNIFKEGGIKFIS